VTAGLELKPSSSTRVSTPKSSVSMGAAPAREAESIVYRRKSFRKKNSSPVSEEPRGSAVGDTTNDSIAPNAR
jgi:hypothetical protein